MRSRNALNRSPKKTCNYNSKRALEYSFWLLGRRARTEKEIRDKLLAKECAQEIIEETIKKLRKLKFIDDFEYAKNYIRQSKIIKPKGKYRLFQELVRKGVEKETVNQAIEEGLGEEEDLVSLALKSYSNKIKNLSREKQYNRAMGYLLRRGFSYDEAKKAVKKYLE